MERKYNDIDVAIIGGGLAGLAAGAYLGRAGRKVVLFEKSSQLGGRAASQDRSGYHFNLGAHAVYEASPAAEVLRELGVRYTGGNPVGVRCMSGGKTYPAPADPLSLLRTEVLGPRAKWEAGRLLLKLQMVDPQSLAGVTLRDWLDKEVKYPNTRRLFEATARVSTYTNAPEHLSMSVFIEQLRQVTRGKIVYVDGGWQSLVDELARVARAAGVTMVPDARVEAVEHEGGDVTGVRLGDSSLVKAQAVVIAAGPNEVARLVAGDHPLLPKWIENAVPVKAASLDVALRRLPNPENKVVFSLDHPLFLTVQSEFSKVTPPGHTLLYTLKYLDPYRQEDEGSTRRELEDWLDQTQPGWRDEVVEARYLPHLTVSNALGDVALRGTQRRPKPEVPGIESLYLAGDWVGPKGILASASLWSAKLAASSILSRQAAISMRQAA